LYKIEKVPRSEVSFGIYQILYVELQLRKTVDWRTFKTLKKVIISTNMDIPRTGPLNNPQDGLVPKKNILEGVADEDYP